MKSNNQTHKRSMAKSTVMGLFTVITLGAFLFSDGFISTAAGQTKKSSSKKSTSRVSAKSKTPTSKKATSKTASSKKTAKSDSPKGRLPRYFGKLGLEDEQRFEIYDIQAAHQERLAELQAQILELKEKLSDEVEEVLTRTQKSELNKLRDGTSSRSSSRSKTSTGKSKSSNSKTSSRKSSSSKKSKKAE